MFYYKGLVDASGANIICSILLCIIFSQKNQFITGQYILKDYKTMTKFWLVFIVIIFAAVPLAIAEVIPNGDIAYVKYIVQSIGIMLAGVQIFYVAPIILERFSIINLNSILIDHPIRENNELNPSQQAISINHGKGQALSNSQLTNNFNL